MLDGVLVRSVRVAAEHFNIGGTACTMGFRSNRTDLDTPPGVYGISEQAKMGIHGPLHSVTLYSENYGVTCQRLTGTTFTATSVTFTSDLDFDDFKRGSSLTIGIGPGSTTGFADSWDAAAKTIYVQGWYKHTGVADTKETPVDGSIVLINYFVKVWAENAVVELPLGADTNQAAGVELDVLNQQADVSETWNASGRYLWGFDIANIGTYKSNTAYIARFDFIEGFLSRGPKYGFRVLPATNPARDLAACGFSYEQGSGTAFRSVVGGSETFKVSYDGNVAIGSSSTVQISRFDFRSSGSAPTFDVRLSSSGGSAADGQGVLTIYSGINVYTANLLRALTNNTSDLGNSTYQWKSLYLGTSVLIGNNKVLGARDTGWGATMTGSADKTTVLDVATATTAQLAARVKALEDALRAHGLIGS
jgi:hypothetical protein